METHTLQPIYRFLASGGEMGQLIRTVDWSTNPLGPIERWPQSLRTTLSLILHSKFPMFLFWGPERICFYNDAYRPSLGEIGKHPTALGQRAVDLWPEIWSTIEPLISQIMAGGEATWNEDQRFSIYRNGQLEETYWTYSYSPVHDESGAVGGVLATCTETTEKVTNLKGIAESKDQLMFAIDAAELGTWDLNPETNRFTGNDRLKSWFGLAPDAEIELPLALATIADEDRQRVIEAIETALQPSSGGNYAIEYTIVNPADQRKRRVKAKGKAVFDDAGKAVRFNGTLQDYTEEYRAGEEQQKLMTLVENSVDLMSVLGLDGRNTYINKAGRELLGIDDDQDVTQVPIADLHTPEQLEFVSSQILPTVMTTGRWSGQFAARNRKTGEIIPLYNNCLRIDDRLTGQPLAVGAVMRDLRPENTTKKALEESREQFRLLADFMPQFVWAAQPSGALNYFNQSVYNFSGLSAEDVQRHNWLRLVHPDERQATVDAWMNSVKTGESFVFQHRFRRNDGEYRWQLSRAVPMKNSEGVIQWWIGTSTDIDDQKKVADELEQMVQQRTLELHSSNQELIKTNHELEQFAYIASHDLQEPLRKIQSFSELLHLNLTDREMSGQYLNKISTSAQRMGELIKSVLNYSRLSNTAERFVETDLNQILAGVESDFELMIEQKGAVIRRSNLPVVEGIPMHLSQLFSNLIGNSLKFSATEPVIEITSQSLSAEEVAQIQGLRMDLPYVYIRVKDNGIGFEQEYAERVFTIFQRLNHTKSYSGTGIGLALCRKIVENHSGKITAESELGNGAAFHIYLPVKR
ncbi:PAS domain-containing protein [Larkinella insperata]|uniref:histidine kinase n=1 Tax=Larkinella insperata TaxID=332158 RepID=A0ABW3PZ42_9BACT|nr:PAS domain-containing protein [Larkinella insperata]